MKQTIGRVRFLGVYVAFTAVGFAAQASAQTYVTNFTKNNSIYSNLNQEYPHSGTGTPGSGTSTANASFLFDPAPAAVAAAGYAPDYVAGSNLANNGVKFLLTSDASGHDFEQIDGGTTLNVPINLSNVSTVYALMGAYNGVTFSATLTAANGATQSFSNIFLPDFNGGGAVNGASGTGGATTKTVFQVRDVGAGGTGNSSNGSFNTYDLTEVAFPLSPALAGQTLSSVSFTSNGYETLLLGVTVPEPGTWALLVGSTAVLFGVAVRRRQAI